MTHLMGQSFPFFLTPTFPDLLFLFVAGLILVCSTVVVFSKNIIHSAFSLLGVFAGVAGVYGLLSANFLAAVQILVYVGGVLIIILFAIMLTRGIQEASRSNPSTGLMTACAVGVIVAVLLIAIAVGFPWRTQSLRDTTSTIPWIGNALLGHFLIPFEILSVVLLAALIGAVHLIRKEIQEKQSEEQG
jgi:NADH-quinone oxidoreductase subunit J